MREPNQSSLSSRLLAWIVKWGSFVIYVVFGRRQRKRDSAQRRADLALALARDQRHRHVKEPELPEYTHLHWRDKL